MSAGGASTPMSASMTGAGAEAASGSGALSSENAVAFESALAQMVHELNLFIEAIEQPTPATAAATPAAAPAAAPSGDSSPTSAAPSWSVPATPRSTSVQGEEDTPWSVVQRRASLARQAVRAAGARPPSLLSFFDLCELAEDHGKTHEGEHVPAGGSAAPQTARRDSRRGEQRSMREREKDRERDQLGAHLQPAQQGQPRLGRAERGHSILISRSRDSSGAVLPLATASAAPAAATPTSTATLSSPPSAATKTPAATLLPSPTTATTTPVGSSATTPTTSSTHLARNHANGSAPNSRPTSGLAAHNNWASFESSSEASSPGTGPFQSRPAVSVPALLENEEAEATELSSNNSNNTFDELAAERGRDSQQKLPSSPPHRHVTVGAVANESLANARAKYKMSRAQSGHQQTPQKRGPDSGNASPETGRRRTYSTASDPGYQDGGSDAGDKEISDDFSETSAVTSLCKQNLADREADVMLVWANVYRPDLDRSGVLNALASAEDGEFIIRPSTQVPSGKTLCLKFGGIVVHFLVDRFDGMIENEMVRGGLRLAGCPVVFSSLLQMVAYLSLHKESLPCPLRLPLDLAEDASGCTSRTHSRTNSEAFHVHVDTMPVAGPLEAANTALSEPTDKPRSVSPINAKEKLTKNLKKGLDFLRARRPTSTNTSHKKVASYLHRLLKNVRSTEHRTVENFIICTRESHEDTYQAVQRNVRQFLDGMRNYLLTQHGSKLATMLPRHHSFSSSSSHDIEEEEISVEGIIEATLQQHVVVPLYYDIYQRILHFYAQRGDLKKLSSNMTVLNKSSPAEVGLEAKFASLDWSPAIASLRRILDWPSPVRKLQQLLEAVAKIHSILQPQEKEAPMVLSADDFLPLFVNVILKAEFYLAEVEAEYMWGLLDPALLNGEGGYYLTSLSSASHWLRSYNASGKAKIRVPSMDDVAGFLRIYFQTRDVSIVFKTFPISDAATVEQTLALICRKFNQQTPENYMLFEVTPKSERRLEPQECPQKVKAQWPSDRTYDDHRLEFRDADPEILLQSLEKLQPNMEARGF